MTQNCYKHGVCSIPNFLAVIGSLLTNHNLSKSICGLDACISCLLVSVLLVLSCNSLAPRQALRNAVADKKSPAYEVLG